MPGDRAALRVALLGCGVVGAEVARLLRARPTTSPRASGARSSSSGSPCATLDRPATGASTRRCSPPTPRASSTRRRRRRRGDRRHRARPHAHPARRSQPASRVVTANKALLAQRRRRAATTRPTRAGVDLYFEAAVAGAIPHRAPAARVAGGRPDPPRPRHRQRHDQLHARPDGPSAARLRRRARRGAGARLRRGRPHRRRRGLRRRGEGRDPRLARVPHRVDARRRLPRGHHRRHRRGHRLRARELGYVIKLLAVAERSRRAASACACTRRWSRATTRSPACAGLQRRVRRGRGRRRSSCSTAAAPAGRPRRRRVLGDVVSAARHRVLGGAGPASRQLRRPAACCRSRRPHALLRRARRRGPARRARRGRRRSFADHGVSIETVRQTGHGDDAAAWSDRDAPRAASAALAPRRCRARCAELDA